MNNNLGWSVLVVVILAVAAYLVWGPTRDESPMEGTIRIGFIGSLTGEAASYGEPQRDALKLAVDDINSSGGIGGRTVEIIYEDGECSGEGGANAAQKLVNVDKVEVILGGSCSSETLAALPIVEKAGVVIVTGSATSPDLVNKSKFFFRVYPNDSAQGTVLANAAYAKGWKNVAVIQEQTNYPLGIYKAFAAAFEPLGGKITKEEFPTGTSDFRSALNKLKAGKPDALFVIVQTVASADRIFKQVKELGWKPALIVNDVVISDTVTVSDNEDFLEGTLGADFVLDKENEKLQKLENAFQIAYGTDIRYPNYTSAVYDSLYIIRDAIIAVGYDGEEIAKWARVSIKDWHGASGSITVGSDGERAAGHSLEVIKNGKAGVVQ